MSTALTFSQALAYLKEGRRVQRTGWNGKGMYLFYVAASEWTLTNGRSDNKALLPFIAMKTADDKVVPWLASQTDMLAEDWEVQYDRASLPTWTTHAHAHEMMTKVQGHVPHYQSPIPNRGHPYRACSWCGSAHPEDIAKSIREHGMKLELADMKYGWPHKVYCSNGAETNPHGYTKFYTEHLMDATPEDKATIEKVLGLQLTFSERGAVTWNPYPKEQNRA